jgi:hypothetical protein
MAAATVGTAASDHMFRVPDLVHLAMSMCHEWNDEAYELYEQISEDREYAIACQAKDDAENKECLRRQRQETEKIVRQWMKIQEVPLGPLTPLLLLYAYPERGPPAAAAEFHHHHRPPSFEQINEQRSRENEDRARAARDKEHNRERNERKHNQV